MSPILIRDDIVKRGNRIFKKVWGVLITCVATRAIYLDVACGMNTEELLHVLRRAMARFGNIKTIISDPGSNFVGAAKELKEWRQGWDKDILTRFGAEKGIEFVTIMANSQHQNGVTEIMVKLAKSVLKSLLKAMGEKILSLNELFTLLAETSQIVNERPIGIKPNESVDSCFLSPNSLLLGRSSARINSGPFWRASQDNDNVESLKSRFRLVQEITNQFWRNWVKLYFPSLIVRQKWHVQHRNLRVGDVCIMRDSNALRGEWRLCRVSSCYPDSSGRVRNVELMLKPVQGGQGDYVPTAPIHVRRHVNNLVLLVPIEEETINEPTEHNGHPTS